MNGSGEWASRVGYVWGTWGAHLPWHLPSRHVQQRAREAPRVSLDADLLFAIHLLGGPAESKAEGRARAPS
eukprot:332771-Chlamydomonas_euryale.AAC.2